MATGLYSIGISGMSAAQLGLLTTEHNITNATTPGYNRQRILQTSNIPVMTGAGSMGQGVSVSNIERSYNEFLAGQVNRAQASVSEMDTFYAQIKQIDNMLADQESGLSPALQGFFSGVQQVAAYPALASSRQSMISSAQAMVARFQTIEGRLSQLYEGVNSQITNTVETINSSAAQIADLNQQIIVAQSAGNHPANDLLDQRDNLVAELNKLVKVTTSTNSDGSFNVFIGSGQQLVVGVQANTLTAAASAADITRIVVGMKTPGGNLELPENLITGGALAGLVNFRSQALDRAANELGRVAASLAMTFNAQHALGQDQLGNVAGDPGFVGDFFTLSGPKVYANAKNTAGGATVTASFVTPPPYNGNFYTDLTGSDYRLSFSAGTLTLTRLSDNKTWSGPDVATINAALATDPQGFTLSDNGLGYTDGDSFLIEPTRDLARNIGVNTSIAADPRLIAVAAPMRTALGATNTGNAVVTAGKISPDYATFAPNGYTLANLPRTLTYDSASGTLSGFPGPVSVTVGGTTTVYGGDPVPYTSGATISFDGLSFEISGVPNTGDTFVISDNAAGVADNRNALLLGQLQSQNTVAGKSASFQTAYAQMVSNNGNKTREVQVTGAAQQKLLEQSSAARDSASGVNLDEEAANLLRYQQAYQASAKMLEIGSRLFDTLLSINA